MAPVTDTPMVYMRSTCVTGITSPYPIVLIEIMAPVERRHVPHLDGGVHELGLVVDHPVVVGVVDEHGEDAGEQVRHEEQQEERERERDGGPVRLEPLPVAQLLELGDEAQGADEAHHADKAEDLQEVARAGEVLRAHKRDDDLVVGEGAGEIRDEPGGHVVKGDAAEAGDGVALVLVGGDEGEDDVGHEDGVDGELEEVAGAPDGAVGGGWGVLEGNEEGDGEAAVEEDDEAEEVPALLGAGLGVDGELVADGAEAPPGVSVFGSVGASERVDEGDEVGEVEKVVELDGPVGRLLELAGHDAAKVSSRDSFSEAQLSDQALHPVEAQHGGAKGGSGECAVIFHLCSFI
eukprot:CAMPEP_0172157704 /NCGR_PEP_ID=MMETSP1050-20130122/3947_1 /TAXON_ID=233186 /ORGANISM="Cryptomonas curvata, Strain CCAP979/52" /LENGTH=348 /DNA_ID=CAMNT_0012826979 /DNA_START=1090 /DNA_END=2135 /DNA_ORIENTATION=-